MGVDLAGVEVVDQAGQRVAADPGDCLQCSLLLLLQVHEPGSAEFQNSSP